MLQAVYLGGFKYLLVGRPIFPFIPRSILSLNDVSPKLKHDRQVADESLRVLGYLVGNMKMDCC